MSPAAARAPSRSASSTSSTLVDESPDLLTTWPEEQVMSPGATLGAWMMEQVADFPAPYRDAILQIDVEGERTADVARALGMSTPGVKSRVLATHRNRTLRTGVVDMGYAAAGK